MTSSEQVPRMEYVEVARAVSDRGEVVLRERHPGAGTEPVLELRVNGVFVMDTAETTTERALATTALAHLADPTHVLVGGLGLGYTARAVLADPRVRRVVVVEIEPAVVGWLRGGTVPHGPDLLADPRLEVVTADLGDAVPATAPDSVDLVLLDVDNGPDFLVHQDNARLYRDDFLRDLVAVLRPGGVVAVWSAAPSPGLVDALTAVVGDTTSLALPVLLQGRREEYVLHLARRPGAPAG